MTHYVTPEDFGAVGDGVTDDKTAIDDALASSTSSVVLLSKKTYGFTGSIFVPDGKSLVGVDPDGSVLLALSGHTPGVQFMGVGSGCTLENFTLDGAKRGAVAPPSSRCHGIILGGKGWLVWHVRVKNITGYGFWANGTSSATSSGSFYDCTATNCNVHFETNHARDVLFKRCEAFDGDNDITCAEAFHPLNNSSNITFENCSYTGDAAPVSVIANTADQTGIRFVGCHFVGLSSTVPIVVHGTAAYSNEVMFSGCHLQSVHPISNGTSIIYSTVRFEGCEIMAGVIGVASGTGSTVFGVDSFAAATGAGASAAYALYAVPGLIYWTNGTLVAIGGPSTRPWGGDSYVSANTVMSPASPCRFLLASFPAYPNDLAVKNAGYPIGSAYRIGSALHFRTT